MYKIPSENHLLPLAAKASYVVMRIITAYSMYSFKTHSLNMNCNRGISEAALIAKVVKWKT